MARSTRGDDEPGVAGLRADRREAPRGDRRARAGGAVIEVKLAGAVVRVSSGMDDAAQLTAVLRAVRASASRS